MRDTKIVRDFLRRGDIKAGYKPKFEDFIDFYKNKRKKKGRKI